MPSYVCGLHFNQFYSLFPVDQEKMVLETSFIFVARFQSPQVDINNFDLLPFSILVGCLKPMSTTVQGWLWQVGNLKFLEIN